MTTVTKNPLAAAERGNGQSADGTKVTVGDWSATAYWSEKFGRAIPVIIRAGNGEFPRQIEVRDLIAAFGSADALSQFVEVDGKPVYAFPVYSACAEACRIAADPKLAGLIKQKAAEKKAAKAAKGDKPAPLTSRVRASDAAAALNAA